MQDAYGCTTYLMVEPKSMRIGSSSSEIMMLLSYQLAALAELALTALAALANATVVFTPHLHASSLPALASVDCLYGASTSSACSAPHRACLIPFIEGPCKMTNRPRLDIPMRIRHHLPFLPLSRSGPNPHLLIPVKHRFGRSACDERRVVVCRCGWIRGYGDGGEAVLVHCADTAD